MWPGLGINYGHVSGLSAAEADSDLTYLYSVGFRKVRLVYPDWQSASLINFKARVQTALNKGFYVVWGTTAGEVVTSTSWAAYKSFVLTDLAPWAQSLNSPNFQLSIGNEEEEHVDGTTVTVQNIVDDVAGSFGAAVKAICTTPKVSYEAAATRTGLYQVSGVGSLDKLGFNVYYGYNPLTGNFRVSVNSIAANFTKAYVSEWNTSGGYADSVAQQALDTEYEWAKNIMQRQAILKSAGLDGYFFCYRDGGFGVTANTYALKKNNGTTRDVWSYLTNTRRAYTL